MKYSYEEVKGILESKMLEIDYEIDGVNKFTDKIDCHCKKHKEEHMNLQLGVIKAGKFGCKQCRKENGKKDYSHEEKIQILLEHGYEYINGDLKSIMNPVHIKCKYNHEFDRSINNIKRGQDKCPFCEGTVSMGYWNKETCQKWIDDNNINYKILDERKEKGKLMLLFQCNCNHEPYWTSWGHFKGGTRCQKCYYIENNKTVWDLEKSKEILKQYGYTMLDENKFISSHNRIDCIDELGFKYPVSIHYITQGRTKFSLWRNNKYAMDNIRRFCELFRPDYEIISKEYLGNKQIHKWKYIGDCLDINENREFDLMFGSFVNSNCGHPSLTRSKLESKCKYILDKYDIKYEMQKTFDGCKDKCC